MIQNSLVKEDKDGSDSVAFKSGGIPATESFAQTEFIETDLCTCYYLPLSTADNKIEMLREC